MYALFSSPRVPLIRFQYLLSGKFQGQQPDRHLIIVAASPLISESSDGYGYHAWYNLAQTMAQVCPFS